MQQPPSDKICEEIKNARPEVDPSILQLVHRLVEEYTVEKKPAVSKPAAPTPASTPAPASQVSKHKGSTNPNYYAAFHSKCTSGQPFGISCTFKYNEPDTKKFKEKQLKFYDELQANTDRLQKLKEFQTDDLQELIKFTEEVIGFKGEQMARTAFIWNYFITQSDRDRYVSYFKNGPPATPAPVQAPVLLKPKLKVAVKLR